MYSAGFLEDLMTTEGGDAKLLNKEKVRDFVADKFPDFMRLVGSAKYSTKRFIGDIDLVTTRGLDKTYKWFEENLDIQEVTKLGSRVMTLTIKMNGHPAKVNVWYSTKEELPYMLLAYSYPKRFNIAIRRKLKKLGYRLNQYGLKDSKGQPVKVRYMSEIFKYAQIDPRTPEEEGKKLGV